MSITEVDRAASWRDAALFVEAIVFTVLVPGTVTVWLPRDVLHLWRETSPSSWMIRHFGALVVLAIGLAIYARCVWDFATRGRGIPGPLDHPKHLVLTGLYRIPGRSYHLIEETEVVEITE